MCRSVSRGEFRTSEQFTAQMISQGDASPWQLHGGSGDSSQKNLQLPRRTWEGTLKQNLQPYLSSCCVFGWWSLFLETRAVAVIITQQAFPPRFYEYNRYRRSWCTEHCLIWEKEHLQKNLSDWAQGPFYLGKNSLMIHALSICLHRLSQNKLGGAAEETRGARVGWAAAETPGGLSDTEAEGGWVEGRWLREDLRTGRRQRRGGLQGLPQTLWSDYGEEGKQRAE